MAFNVKDQFIYFATVIHVRGRFLGHLDQAQFKETINNLKEAGKTNVVVDLTKATFMDSGGLGVIVAALATMRNAGGDIRLAGMNKRLTNVFLISRLLGDVFEAYETVDEALAAFAPEGTPPA